MKHPMKKISGMNGSPAAVRSVRSGQKMTACRLRQIIGGLLLFLAAVLLTGTAAFPGTYPFGLALSAAVSGTGAVLVSLCGSAAGALRIPSGGGGYAAGILLLTAVRFLVSRWFCTPAASGGAADGGGHTGLQKILYRLRADSGGCLFREPIRIRAVLAGGAALGGGIVAAAAGGFSPYALFGALFSLLVTPLVSYLFYTARERSMRASPLREGAVYFSAAVLTMALSAWTQDGLDGVRDALFGTRPAFDAGMLFALAAALVTSLEYGPHRGALLGLSCGVMLPPALAPACALAGLAGGIFAPYSTVFALVCGAALASVWAVWTAGFPGLVQVFVPAAVVCAVLLPLYRHRLLHLPDTLFGGTDARTRVSREENTLSARTAVHLKERMTALSEGMLSVSAVLGGLSERLTRPARSEYERMTETAFDTYCRTCRLRERCSAANNERTQAVMRAVTEELCREGVVTARVIPAALASSCFHMGQILDAINTAAGQAGGKKGEVLAMSALDYGLAGELLRQAAVREAADREPDAALEARLRHLLTDGSFRAASVTAWGTARRKHVFVGDVDVTATRLGGAEIRRLFSGAAGTAFGEPSFELDGAVLSMRLSTAEAFTCTAGMYACSLPHVRAFRKQQQAEPSAEAVPETGAENRGGTVQVTDHEPDDVCGDGMTAFAVDGRQYMILSDGMGSGREAALTSGVVVSLLERLIRAGAELETALKMLNAIVRATERECAATVDLAEIDLFTGEARFVKSGAAPSFVLRDGSIFRLQSKTVPIGILRALDAEMIRFDVQPGDTVVMVSDGAARSYEEVPWLLDLMTEDETILHGDERQAAAMIVTEAALRGSEDDISAGILRIHAVPDAS